MLTFFGQMGNLGQGSKFRVSKQNFRLGTGFKFDVHEIGPLSLEVFRHLGMVPEEA